MSAFSFVAYTGDGTTGPFAVPFSYLSQNDVAATVSGVAVALVWETAASVRLASAAPAGAPIEIRRTTPRSAPAVDFTDGSVLTEADLDRSALQQLYVAQELTDLAQTTVSLGPEGSHDAGGLRIGNLGAPLSGSDAVTKDYADATAAIAAMSASSASAAAETAEAWASAAVGLVVADGLHSARHYAEQVAALASGVGAAPATEAAMGVVMLAAPGEAAAGLDAAKAVTAQGVAAALDARIASETAPGLVELADAGEAAVGADATRAATPAGVTAALDARMSAPALNSLLLDPSGFSGNLAPGDATVQAVANRVDGLSPGGLSLLASTTLAADANEIVFTGLDWSTYSSYQIDAYGIYGAGGYFGMQASGDNGGSWYSSGYDWRFQNSSTLQAATNDARIYFSENMPNAASKRVSFCMKITPYRDDNTGIMVFGNGSTAWSSNNALYLLTHAGRYENTNTIDAVRLFMSSGDISAGSFRLYGVL